MGISTGVLSTVCVFLLLQAGQSKFVHFRDCGSPSATLQTVNISPCSVEPCEFTRDVNIVTEISFVSKMRSFATATLAGTVLVGGQVFPLPIDEPNLCKALTSGRCPLTVGNFYAISGNKTVPASVPTVGPMTFQMKGLGARNETIFCVEYNVKV